MDGVNYYGFEDFNVGFGSGHRRAQRPGHQRRQLELRRWPASTRRRTSSLAGGNDQVFVSSNADLDAATILDCGADVFEFLTGDLDDVRGA